MWEAHVQKEPQNTPPKSKCVAEVWFCTDRNDPPRLSEIYISVYLASAEHSLGGAASELCVICCKQQNVLMTWRRPCKRGWGVSLLGAKKNRPKQEMESRTGCRAVRVCLALPSSQRPWGLRGGEGLKEEFQVPVHPLHTLPPTPPPQIEWHRSEAAWTGPLEACLYQTSWGSMLDSNRTRPASAWVDTRNHNGEDRWSQPKTTKKKKTNKTKKNLHWGVKLVQSPGLAKQRSSSATVDPGDHQRELLVSSWSKLHGKGFKTFRTDGLQLWKTWLPGQACLSHHIPNNQPGWQTPTTTPAKQSTPPHHLTPPPSPRKPKVKLHLRAWMLRRGTFGKRRNMSLNLGAVLVSSQAPGSSLSASCD